ncbi:MAG TPA: hypothetical protein VJG85_00010 [Patescibacteria group bacterium]|nr:hypothetical protein [Patescibacteria group bacterium]
MKQRDRLKPVRYRNPEGLEASFVRGAHFAVLKLAPGMYQFICCDHGTRYRLKENLEEVAANLKLYAVTIANYPCIECQIERNLLMKTLSKFCNMKLISQAGI